LQSKGPLQAERFLLTGFDGITSDLPAVLAGKVRQQSLLCCFLYLYCSFYFRPILVVTIQLSINTHKTFAVCGNPTSRQLAAGRFAAHDNVNDYGL